MNLINKREKEEKKNEQETISACDKSKMPLTMGIAFVAFTTQFGGGFASGAPDLSVFYQYGVWCLVLPILTQGLYSLFYWYGHALCL